MVVIDSSVLIDVVVTPQRSRDRLRGEELAAPHLVDAEVGHALRRMVRRGRIDADVAEAALGFAQLDITRYAHVALLPRAWELRNNLSYYDALYIALAEALDVPLVTLDSRMAGVPGTSALVEVIT